MKVLGIETSCDDTSIALIEASGGIENPQFHIIKNVVSSQIEIHRPFGGVVPNLAKREHENNLPIVYRQTMRQEDENSVDLIAVTVGPGLDPALWTGIEFSKKIAKKLKKPLIGTNHLEGHIYSNWIDNVAKDQKSDRNIEFPLIALIVSGGHTILLKMNSILEKSVLGETRDDAAGEAFDKVARLLGLPYPGGPEIEKLAKTGEKNIDFPRPMIKHGGYEFSFSGLKTSVLYYLRDNPGAKKEDIAASFQDAVTDVLVTKARKAAEEHNAKSVLLSGGVGSNRHVQNALEKQLAQIDVPLFIPDLSLNTDNAAMIAAAGYIAHQSGKKQEVESQPNMKI